MDYNTVSLSRADQVRDRRRENMALE